MDFETECQRHTLSLIAYSLLSLEPERLKSSIGHRQR
jgi:hypothetical protein